MKDFHDALHGD